VTKTELAKAVIKKYGEQNQAYKMIEEGAELTAALCRLKIGQFVQDHVAEEMADCYLVLNQMDTIFGKITEKEERLLDNIKDSISIMSVIGDTQSWLSDFMHEEFDTKRLKECFYFFRKKLNELSAKIGEEKVNAWIERKSERMIHRLENS